MSATQTRLQKNLILSRVDSPGAQVICLVIKHAGLIALGNPVYIWELNLSVGLHWQLHLPPLERPRGRYRAGNAYGLFGLLVMLIVPGSGVALTVSDKDERIHLSCSAFQMRSGYSNQVAHQALPKGHHYASKPGAHLAHQSSIPVLSLKSGVG